MKKDLSIGEQVKRARKAKGLSQKRLAEMIGIKQPSLSDIESGRSEPREVTLAALAHVLDADFGHTINLRVFRTNEKPWDVLMRPFLQKVRDQDIYLYWLIYRLGEISPSFRDLLKDGVYERVSSALREVFGDEMGDDAVSQDEIGGEVGPIVSVEQITVRHFGKVSGGEDVNDEEANTRKRKTG